MKNIILLAFVVLFFQGCIIERSEYYKTKYILSTKVTNFDRPTKRLVLEMNEELHNIAPRVYNSHIYAVDFVNIRNLETTSELGLFLSSEIKKHISQMYDFKVREMEYMKYFKIGQNGTKALSRNINELNMSEIDQTYSLIGTYVVTQRQLIMYLKLVDMKTGDILETTSNSIELTDEILKLENQQRQVGTATPFIL